MILLSEMEHHANIVPWQLPPPRRDPPQTGGLDSTPSPLRGATLRRGSTPSPDLTLGGEPRSGREAGVGLRWIPVTDSGELDLSNLDELLNGVKLVAVTQMSNVLGTVNNVKFITEKAHAVGAKILVDAAQSVPHMPVDVQDLDCDFLVFSGHKMCGPMGIGILYAKQELLEQMEPYQRGGDMILEVTKETATWNELPYKFEAGTPNAAGAVGLGAAIDYLSAIGMEKIWEHEQELSRYGLEQLSKLSGVRVLGTPTTPARIIPTSTSENAKRPLRGNGSHPPGATPLRQGGMGRGAIFALDIPSVHPHDIGSILDEHHIAVRAGHHCAQPLHHRFGLTATTRASCYLYNTKEDIEALFSGIKTIQAMFS